MPNLCVLVPFDNEVDAESESYAMSESSPEKPSMKGMRYQEAYSEEEEEDDGEGVLSHNDREPLSGGSSVPDDQYVKNRESLDNFIRRHNAEGVELDEEDREELDEFGKELDQRPIYKPRNTYEVLLNKIEIKRKQMKDVSVSMNFEQKKKALARKDYAFSEDEWEEILKHDGKNKLYEVSNKRLKESLINGIPDRLRGVIWWFLWQAKFHRDTFNTGKTTSV